MALFDEKDEELVKKFLFNKIEKESDADPAIMTDYILVTLQNEMSESELKAHCMTDLAEFFGDRTLVFVNTLFEALGRQQYLPGSSSSNNSDKAPVGEQPRRGGAENGHMNRRRSRSPDSRSHGGRDRERERDRRGRSSRSPSRERQRMPARDPGSMGNDMALLNGPLEPAGGNHAMFGHQQPYQEQQHQQQQQQQQRRRKPCFEFMRRGACQRGDQCSYAHVTPEQAQMMGMAPGPGIMQGGPMGQQQRGGPFMGQQQQQQPGFFPMGMRPPAMHMQGAGGIRPEGNSQPMSTTAVFVSNIPDEALSEGSVSEFFTRFGAIQDVRIDFARHSAVVEFGDSGAQAQALSTPEAIFNNRFVRVHKARMHHSGALSAPTTDNGHHNRPQPPPPQPQQAPVWRPKSATIKKAEMIEKFVEQQKELMKKLTTTKDMPPTTRKIIMDSINQIQKKIDDIRRPKPAEDAVAVTSSEPPAADAATEAGVGSSVEAEKQALQAKLKALQMETTRLAASSARGGRGGGARGGRGGAHHGSMSLDRRPRTLVLRNVGQEAAERLGSEMAQFGEIEHIDKTEERNDPPFTYAVKFKARWEAEAAMKAVTSLDSFSDVSADWDQ